MAHCEIPRVWYYLKALWRLALARLITALFFSLIFAQASYANEDYSPILPKIKQILISQAQTTGSYQLAYTHIKKVAIDAIEYKGMNASLELEAAFVQIEKEISYEVLQLNRQQLAKLILRALNS